jgi:hypothetical protein
MIVETRIERLARRIGLQVACLLSISGSAPALEVTGVVQKEISVFGPVTRKVGIEGAFIRFTSESNPGEFYSDSTDSEGRFRIDLDEQDTAVNSENNAKPIAFQLNQNYPNPFNPGTVISYQLPRAAAAQLVIYNSIGQRIRTLVDDFQELGSHAVIWDGRDDDGRALASGVYIYRLTAGSFSEARKMVLIDGPNSSRLSDLPLIMGNGGGRSTASKFLRPPAAVELIEGVPVPHVARKLAQLRSFVVTINAYKLVPLETPGLVVMQDTMLSFLMEEDTREGLIFLKEGQRQLFLDDYNIEEMSGLTRTMHQPRKKGAVIRPNWLEGETSLQTRSAPFWDPLEEVYKLWLIDGTYRTSPDGLHWVPAPEGDTGVSEVFFDPLDPDPERRYKSFHPKRLAVSPDGRNWTVLPRRFPSASDEWNFSLDLENRLYVATFKMGGPYGRAVYLTKSESFVNWSTPELIFHADELDQELGRENIEQRFSDESLLTPLWNDPSVYNVDTYNMGVFRYESVYLGTPAMFHSVAPVPNYPNTDGFHVIQLALSRDLKTWTRLGDRQPFIGPSKRDSGAYDLTQLIGPSRAIVRGDELWFYYTGIKYRGAGLIYVGTFPDGEWVHRPGFDVDTGAICLAVLRRDGFISLDAGRSEGVLLTKPLVWRGSSLWTNVTTQDGEVRVEVLDENGDLLREGLSRARSMPVVRDGVRLPVAWQDEHNLAELRGQLVRLRFVVRDAELYSFWTEQ